MPVKITAPEEVVRGNAYTVTASGRQGDRFVISWTITSEIVTSLLANGVIGPYEIPQNGVLEIPFQHPSLGHAPSPTILMTAATSGRDSGGDTSTVLVKIIPAP